MSVTQMSAEARSMAALPFEALTPLELAPGAARRRNARNRWALRCLGVDAATLAAAAIASMVVSGADGTAWSFDGWTLAFCLLSLALFRGHGLYELRLRIPVADDVRRLAACTSVAAIVVLTTRLFVTPADATQTVRPWIFALVYVVGGRVALYWSESKARAAGEAARPTLIVGAGRIGRVVARRILAERRLGLDVVGFVDADPRYGDDDLGVPVLGALGDLEDLVERHGIEQLVVSFSGERDEVLLDLVNRAEALGVAVSIVPRLYEKTPGRLAVEHLGGVPLITPRPADPRGLEIEIKYALDRIVAALLLALLSPLFLAAAAAVAVTSGRPVFFRQPRVGLDGQVFEMLKFRTMRAAQASSGIAGEADAPWLAAQLGQAAAESVVFDTDNRRTPVGAILRRTSLDELPQLLNVLKGEMSLVGPRPERVAYVERLQPNVYRYGDRHRVKAGITGWAQVHGLRGNTSLADRVEWDNYYVENFSLWLDLKILALTVAAVFRAFGEVQ